MSAVEPADLAIPISSATQCGNRSASASPAISAIQTPSGKSSKLSAAVCRRETGLALIRRHRSELTNLTVTEALHRFVEFVYSSNERTQLDGEIVEVGIECFEIGELGSQVGMRQLIEMFRRSQDP